MTVHKNAIFYLKVRDIYALYGNLPKQNHYYNKSREGNENVSTHKIK